MKYKRIILKLSGEALADKSDGTILDNEKLKNIALAVKLMHEAGVEIGIVIGAGNIFRGKIASKIGVDQTNGDYMGMLGTIINCIALSSSLEKIGVTTRVMSAVEVNKIAEPYIYKKAIAHLNCHKVVLFAGGTGNPYFTTDTCASLRALEINADAILMAKNGVDGVYTDDPKTNKNAKFIKKLTYKDIINKNLHIMDQTAITMLEGSKKEVRIFSMDKIENFIKVINGDDIGSTITEE
ncbi:MAG: UMP kinase [Firmicutes bacterium]|uniref:Uridylate kinase n=1 Tax=Candidatus Onthovivens merdipullorum TaxID=2840889 RepID=A0A9D9DK97_9BACL|nr:UMP kinase [Candidatus Onthovivens merdipullorum]